MFRSLLAFALTSLALGHQELYKQYQTRGNAFSKGKSPVYGVSSPLSNDANARDSSLFVPPLAGQTGIDYHPQLKQLHEGEQIIYYSWHVHVYFFHEDQNVTDRTLAVRDQFISRFKLATCNDSCFMGGPFDTCNQGGVVLIFNELPLTVNIVLNRNVCVGPFLWC